MKPKDNTSTVGPFIGSIIIILVLTIGALYIWAQKLASSNSTTATSTTKTLKADDLKSIEADLKTTDVSKFDTRIKTLK